MPTDVTLAVLVRQKKLAIIERWRMRVASGLAGEDLSRAELLDHMPDFIGELGEQLDRLAAGRSADRPEDRESESAPRHGRQRLRVGFDVDEVIREYGTLADVILELCESEAVPVSAAEGRLLAANVSAGAAEAISAYVKRRDEEAHRQTTQHLAFIAHELRNPLGGAWVALNVLLARKPPGLDGPLGVLQRSLTQLRKQMDDALTVERLQGLVKPECEAVDVGRLLDDVRAEGLPEAEIKGVRLVVDAPVTAALEGDRRLLRSVLTNLVRNAVKFSVPDSVVTVRVRQADDATVLEVEDACGGLPAGSSDIFEPFVQRGGDRSGFGLGLAIAKQAVEAHGGTIEAHDHPGRGCVFRVVLPARRPDAG